MQIDWWTLALQGINFLVLVWLLQRFLYRPVRRVIEKRKELAERAFAEASHGKEEAAATLRRLEEDRRQLAQERLALLKTLQDEIDSERRKILEQARREAAAERQAAGHAIDEERAAAFAAIREDVAELAVDFAASVLRQAGASTPSDIFLAQLERQLASLPAAERERLHKDLRPDGARLTVVTASPLATEEQQRWLARLGACLGENDKTDFAADPAIVGGAELRSPHIVLKFTWADQLAKAKDLLRTHETAS